MILAYVHLEIADSIFFLTHQWHKEMGPDSGALFCVASADDLVSHSTCFSYGSSVFNIVSLNPTCRPLSWVSSPDSLEPYQFLPQKLFSHFVLGTPNLSLSLHLFLYPAQPSRSHGYQLHQAILNYLSSTLWFLPFLNSCWELSQYSIFALDLWWSPIVIHIFLEGKIPSCFLCIFQNAKPMLGLPQATLDQWMVELS